MQWSRLGTWIGAVMPLVWSQGGLAQVDRRGEMQPFGDAPRSIYQVQDFSDRYSASVEIVDSDEVSRPGIIRVRDKRSNQVVIEVSSDGLLLDLADGKKVKANVHELPYGEQSLIVAEDFNFDGAPDLAVMDGQMSCYGGPSYQIYLNTASGLSHDDDFTALAQDNCGLFEADAKAQRLYTMTKDGCCWHEQSTYAIVGGKPVEILHEEQAGGGNIMKISGWSIKNGKRVNFLHRQWMGDDDPDTKILMSFRLSPSGKRVMLYTSAGSELLNYVILQSKDEVALAYPAGGDGGFQYSPDRERLSFTRGDTRYVIVGPGGEGGLHMEVIVHGKSTRLRVDQASLEGGLSALKGVTLNNLESGKT